MLEREDVEPSVKYCGNCEKIRDPILLNFVKIIPCDACQPKVRVIQKPYCGDYYHEYEE